MAHPIVPALFTVALVASIWAMFSLWEHLARRRTAARSRALLSYAEARSLKRVSIHEAARSSSPPLLAGEVGGVPIEMCVLRGATRVEGALAGVAPGFVMVIAPRDKHARIKASPKGLEEAPTGNKAFDAAFALLSNEPDLARSILDRRLAQVVLGFPRAFMELSAEGRRFALAWRGVETDTRVLDAAVEVVFTACRRRA